MALDHRPAALLGLTLLAALPTCQGGFERQDPCEAVSCSGHGQCWTDGETPRCECDEGFVATGTECLDDADADADTDVDADAEDDGDAEAAIDGGSCALLGQPCDGRPCCDEVQNLCVGSFHETGRSCRRRCTPTPCDYGWDEGYCLDTGVMGLCFPSNRLPPPSSCAALATGCETEYGASGETGADTFCGPWFGIRYCVERCASTPTGCGFTVACVVDDGESFCAPWGS